MNSHLFGTNLHIIIFSQIKMRLLLPLGPYCRTLLRHFSVGSSPSPREKNVKRRALCVVVVGTLRLLHAPLFPSPCCPLLVACCMLHTACCRLHPACCASTCCNCGRHATYCSLFLASCFSYVSCMLYSVAVLSVLPAVCCLLLAACCLLPATKLSRMCTGKR